MSHTEIRGKEVSKVTHIAAFENYVRATAAGDTNIWVPTVGSRVRVKVLFVFNSGAIVRSVIIKFGAAGATRFRADLAANSGFLVNLIDVNKEGAVNTALIVNLDGIGTVDVTADGEELAE